MQLTNQEAERLLRQGVEALRQGKPSEARPLFQRVTDTGRANAQIWMLLATACRGEGDTQAEEAALDQLLAMEPRAVRAHIMKADCRARAGDRRGAFGFYKSATLIAADQVVPADLAAELQRAETVIANMARDLDGQRELTLAARGLGPDNRSARFQQSLDIMAGRKRIFVQEPTGYYFPALPQIQFFDPAQFDWAAAIEGSYTAIREELQAILATGTKGFRPYIEGDPNRARVDDNQLIDSDDWSALFLCENGKEFGQTIARAPVTWDTLQSAPMPRIANSPTAMFSLLKGGARIAAHTGMTNTRLVCHLPLIVPPGCGFRVGNEVRQWEEGKLMIFDDTIEHEAWNDSDQDRVVLIFDIWRPELNEREREEIAALFSVDAVE